MRPPPYGALVVDDEPMLVSMLRRILVGAGFVVVTAADGNEGIAILSEGADDIDVVFCDLLMPGNGSTLARHLRAQYPEISLVVMTGLDDHEAERRAHGLGVVACLTKPFESAQHVVATLTRAADMTRARRAHPHTGEAP